MRNLTRASACGVLLAISLLAAPTAAVASTVTTSGYAGGTTVSGAAGVSLPAGASTPLPATGGEAPDRRTHAVALASALVVLATAGREVRAAGGAGRKARR